MQQGGQPWETGKTYIHCANLLAQLVAPTARLICYREANQIGEPKCAQVICGRLFSGCNRSLIKCAECTLQELCNTSLRTNNGNLHGSQGSRAVFVCTNLYAPRLSTVTTTTAEHQDPSQRVNYLHFITKQPRQSSSVGKLFLSDEMECQSVCTHDAAAG